MALIRRRFDVPIRRMKLRLEVRRSDAVIFGARNRCDCMAEFRALVARKLTVCFLGLRHQILEGEVSKVDNKNRVKESENVEGGFLDMGFNFFKSKFEIKENTNKDTSLLKVHTEYEVKEELAANASLVTKKTYVDVAKLANEHFAKS
nr:S-norcoclaurine synthase 2-like [Tanacetum cinerariifolium]